MLVERDVDDNLFQRFSHLRPQGYSDEDFKLQMKRFHDTLTGHFHHKYPKITTSSYIHDDLEEFPSELLKWANRIVRSIVPENSSQTTLQNSDFRETKTKGLANNVEVFTSTETYIPPQLNELEMKQLNRLKNKYPPPTQKQITNFVYALGDMWFLKASKYVSYKTPFPFGIQSLDIVLDRNVDKKLDQILRSSIALSTFDPLLYMFSKEPTSIEPIKVPHPFSATNQYSISWRHENFIHFSADDELSELDICDFNELIAEYNNIQTIPTLIVILYCALRFNIHIKSLPNFPKFMRKDIKKQLSLFNNKKEVMKVSYNRARSDTQE